MTGQRPTVEDLIEIYRIDETVIQPTPKNILLADDVLTDGHPLPHHVRYAPLATSSATAHNQP